MADQTAVWIQFRRLLLGTVMEALLDHAVEVDFTSTHIRFDDASEFHVPRLNNYMRFVGSLEADLREPLDADRVKALEATLRRAWPDLLDVLDIPMGDRLTSERNDIRVDVDSQDASSLRVVFDLAAD